MLARITFRPMCDRTPTTRCALLTRAVPAPFVGCRNPLVPVDCQSCLPNAGRGSSGALAFSSIGEIDRRIVRFGSLMDRLNRCKIVDADLWTRLIVRLVYCGTVNCYVLGFRPLRPRSHRCRPSQARVPTGRSASDNCALAGGQC